MTMHEVLVIYAIISGSIAFIEGCIIWATDYPSKQEAPWMAVRLTIYSFFWPLSFLYFLAHGLIYGKV